MDLTRRTFLKSTAAASATLALPNLSLSAPNEVPLTTSTQSLGEHYRLGDAWSDLVVTVASESSMSSISTV